MARAEICSCHKRSGYFISALPGGNRNNNGTFNNLGNNGNWWTATENNTNNAWNRNMNYNNSNVNRNNNKTNGFSVRCVRDLKENRKPMQVVKFLRGFYYVETIQSIYLLIQFCILMSLILSNSDTFSVTIINPFSTAVEPISKSKSPIIVPKALNLAFSFPYI